MGEPIDDRALVHAAQGGDRRALDTLLRRHYDRIFAVCRRITGSSTDAADAAQDALIAIVRGLPRFDGRSAVSTWMFRIATNASLDELRRRNRRPMPAGSIGPDDAGTSAGGGDHADAAATASLDRVADRIDVDAALQSLPADFRAALVLRDLVDLDYAAIAEILGVPVGTVKSRIARGRAALAEVLPGNPGAAPERPTSAP